MKKTSTTHICWKVVFSQKVFISIAAILLIGCSSRDENLERSLSKRLVEFSHNNVEMMDLRTVFGDDWEKVCLQGPYMEEERFEKMVGRKVRGFEYALDDVYIFWIIYRDGTYRLARVPRVAVMDKHENKGTWCTDFDNPYLFAADLRGSKRYYFLDEKKEPIGAQ